MLALASMRREDDPEPQVPPGPGPTGPNGPNGLPNEPAAGALASSQASEGTAKRWASVARKLTNNYAALSAAVGLLVFVLMCVIRPPLVQKKPTNILQTPTLSLSKAAMLGVAASAVMVGAPVVWRLYTSK